MRLLERARDKGLQSILVMTSLYTLWLIHLEPLRRHTHCWYFFTLTEKSASARKYRCSTSPRSIQGIIFSTRNGCVIVFYLDYPEEDKR